MQHAVDTDGLTAAPCSDDSKTRRSALPRVTPEAAFERLRNDGRHAPLDRRQRST